MSDFPKSTCLACEGGVARLDPDSVRVLLRKLPEWALVAGDTAIERTFSFENYWQTMAFVNAVAWVAHTEDHHPEMSVHWGKCIVRYNTHAVGGLTDNDFICAEKVSRIVSG